MNHEDSAPDHPAYDFPPAPDAYAWAGGEKGLEFLYAFLEQDLEACLEDERALLPQGLEDLLASDSLEDYVWLWLKHPGPRGFKAFIATGADFRDIEVDRAYATRVQEWAIDNPPHVTWLREDGYEAPANPFV